MRKVQGMHSWNMYEVIVKSFVKILNNDAMNIGLLVMPLGHVGFNTFQGTT